MATYEELYSLMTGQSGLRNRVAVAILVAAEAIRSETVETQNHANRLVWAAEAFGNPKGFASKHFMAVLAANKDVSVESIVAVSDAVLQSAVDGVVDLFATGA